jgi:hypothetical protein
VRCGLNTLGCVLPRLRSFWLSSFSRSHWTGPAHPTCSLGRWSTGSGLMGIYTGGSGVRRLGLGFAGIFGERASKGPRICFLWLFRCLASSGCSLYPRCRL